MEINGVSLELNVLDADVLESYEKALATMQEQSQQDFSAPSYSESIRMQCRIVHQFFDDVFGEGTSENVFQGKSDLRACLRAASAVVEEANRQFSELNSFGAKYSPNRAQRSAASKVVKWIC